jgi:hypothetical protein
MADGISGIMADSGASGVPRSEVSQEEEKIDAETETSRPNQTLSRVRSETDKKILQQRSAGGSNDIFEASVLQSGLHGRGVRGYQSSDRTEQSAAIRQEAEAIVREVRVHARSSLSSLGRKSTQQRPAEPNDVVLYLSHTMASAEWETESAASGCLLHLLDAFVWAGVLLEALPEIPQVWRSASDEARQRIGCFLCSRGAEWLVSSPLMVGEAGRIMRLRGYGNSVVAPLAAEFIKAFMETLP